MSKVVGITGGIGSGKSTVCRVFQLLGVPVFNSDVEAKKLYTEDEFLKKQVIDLFGEALLTQGKLDHSKLAAKVFNDPIALTELNQLVHPRVREKFKIWLNEQNTPYVLKEAAILIESGSYKECDSVILVTAPADLKEKRLIANRAMSAEAIKDRMAKQMSDEDKRPYCQYNIVNDEKELMVAQALVIHRKILTFLEKTMG
jgi:dephospho-CoA kinase